MSQVPKRFHRCSWLSSSALHRKAPEGTCCPAAQLSSFSLAFQLLPQLPWHCRHNPIFYLSQCLTTLIGNLQRDCKVWSYVEILAAGTSAHCAITSEVQKRDGEFHAGNSLPLKKFKLSFLKALRRETGQLEAENSGIPQSLTSDEQLWVNLHGKGSSIQVLSFKSYRHRQGMTCRRHCCLFPLPPPSNATGFSFTWEQTSQIRDIRGPDPERSIWGLVLVEFLSLSEILSESGDGEEAHLFIAVLVRCS